ncbi:bifunctional tetrahydrofolate synthase/dihydrofolate synthase [Thorsellia kenyensis]|uniref:Dihydrofolate synthase/folylpolyglutamate synthase n=1 Tax=Thorsellia kenyensis TaxID=1549888 RepID=A0ABV6CDA0_9GAMM
MKEILDATNNKTPPSINDDLDTWLAYLETIHTQSIDMGLQRSFEVAKNLDLLKPAPLIITVGGTNGKGTTCRSLELFFLEAGFKVGVYSSPHLLHYNERVRINGQELADIKHVDAFNYLENNRGSLTLTYFEFGTLSALHLFKQAQLDIVILEVGLGGRLDSCNIIDANVAVITSIDIDHIDWLGDDREAIAKEKAGIFRSNNPAVIGEPFVPETMIEEAKRLNTPLFEVGQSWHYTENADYWHWHGPDFCLNNLPYPKVPLANAATAIATLYISGFLNGGKDRITPEIIRMALSKVSMPGRFQVVKTQTITIVQEKDPTETIKSLEIPQVILDVAHNPHASRYLTNQLVKLKKEISTQTHNCQIHLIIGMLQDKDIQNTLLPLTDVIDSWHCISLDGARGASAYLLSDKLKSLPNLNSDEMVFTYNTMNIALEKVNSLLATGDIIVICGSFYTVAEYLALCPEPMQLD